VTYFIRDDDGPFDEMAELEHEAWREAMILSKTHGKEIGCLFPDIHDPGHPKDMRFRVRMPDATDWEYLDEEEIRHYADGRSFLASSQFDFWWE
jgi:hypothetical protein